MQSQNAKVLPFRREQRREIREREKVEFEYMDAEDEWIGFEVSVIWLMKWVLGGLAVGWVMGWVMQWSGLG